MRNKKYSAVGPSFWVARSLRFIVFLEKPIKPGTDFIDQKWWEEVCGRRPDSSSRKTDKVEESGKDGPNQRISLRIEPFKIIWTIEPVIEEEPPGGELPSLGPFFEKLNAFQQKLSPWFQKAPPLKRLSLHAGLMLTTSSSEEALKTLDSLLETVDVRSDSRDFVYRNNLATNSEYIPGLQVNRIATWQSVRFVVSVTDVTGTGTATEVLLSESFACILDLDINTFQEQTSALPSDKVDSLAQELGHFAKDIATKGERKEQV